MSRRTRIKACELAAEVMANRTGEALIPQLWAATVFFEEYIEKGAQGTRKAFGPKKPAKLKVIKNG